MSESPEEPNKKPRRPSKIQLVGGGDLPPGLGEALQNLLGGLAERVAPPIDGNAPTPDLVKTLRSLHAAISAVQKFEPGEIVRFKPGLNHTRISNFGVFTSYLPADERPRGAVETSNPLFCDVSDCVIGVLVDQGIYFEYAADSRRLEKVPLDELG